jgi:transcriptional regulator with GAF, ATPase, and Fis domain
LNSAFFPQTPQLFLDVPGFGATRMIVDSLLATIRRLLSRRFLLFAAGIFSCGYALTILASVPFIPDLGLRTLFSAKLSGMAPGFVPEGERKPVEGDTVTKIGGTAIRVWPDLLRAPLTINKEREEIEAGIRDGTITWARRSARDDGLLIRVRFESEAGESFVTWCELGRLPAAELFPSFLWFFLKVFLFTVGAIVFWKRPNDDAAALFFLLCVVTLGAYVGGYHWSHFTTRPVFLIIFMICGILLPVVNLHFYLLFPRKKVWLATHPRRTILAIYGPPLLTLALVVVSYIRVRAGYQALPEQPSAEALAAFDDRLQFLRLAIVVTLSGAAVWYVGCLAALIHSQRTVTLPEERKQVQCILFGLAIALVPIAFSLIVVLCAPTKFAEGWATWPMFFASAVVTGAFAVSITRYRLMELDKLISSSMAYFLVSFVATLLYYAVAFVGYLIFNQVIAGPSISEALSVSTTALLLMLVLDLARGRVKKVLDRRFSRNKSQLDQTLQQMSQAVADLVDPPALAQRLLRATAELLGVSRGAVYLREGDPPIFRLAGHVGAAPALHELAQGFPLVEALQGGYPVPRQITRGLPDTPTPARRQLAFLGGELAHPLTHDGRLLALLVLGPKDPPYRPEDSHVLTALAQLTVPALVNAAGHRVIELLNRDLQAKVDQIAAQQRRILALQTQLHQTATEPPPARPDTLAAEAARDTEAAVPGGIVGSGPVVRQLLTLVRKVAATDAAVLIRGESGTGKELLARGIHETSARALRPYVKVHCAALSPGLLESELFGHVKGAFTGAHRDKVGRFEMANGGTLFLDEIGDISLDVQTKLLRVLQEQTFERVGSSDPVRVDVRIVTATHQNLEELIRRGRFREDLFYRLNVFPLHAPPLRERGEDVPELAEHFLSRAATRFRKEVKHIDDDALTLLKGFAWPGNIRQLENVIERAVVIAEGSTITPAELPPDIFDAGAPNESTAPTEPLRGDPVWKTDRERIERDLLVRALAAAGGNKAEAARALGVARSTLLSRLKKLGLA